MASSDFFSSDAGQCASLAKEFLEGALTLDAAQHQSNLLFRPILALAGHGLELMLKASIYWNKGRPPTSGREGHDINRLWKCDKCELVRRRVIDNASLVANDDRGREFYDRVPDPNEVQPLIEEYIKSLGELHGRRDYPLRYPTNEIPLAPVTPFLVKTLWRTSDDLVKRPRSFLQVCAHDDG